jgi:uncharacterized membrane protein YidH (DUF202 family)
MKIMLAFIGVFLVLTGLLYWQSTKNKVADDYMTSIFAAICGLTSAILIVIYLAIAFWYHSFW